MPMCFVDVDREPVRTRSATRKRSVSFGRNRPLVRSTGRETITTYQYNPNPPYIPPAPVPSSLGNFNPRENSWHTAQRIPGAFPDQTPNIVYAANPNYYSTTTTASSTKVEPARSRPSSPPSPSLIRRKSFGNYIPNPLGWASNLISGKKQDNNYTTSLFTSTTTPTSKMTTFKSSYAIDEKEKVDHERTLRLYSEQRHQELVKQQLLELELKKATNELELRTEEEEARRRLFNVSALAAAEQASMAVAPYHHHQRHHHQHHHPPAIAPAAPPLAIGYHDPCAATAHHQHHHHHGRHFYTWKHSHLSPEEVAARRYRREHHHCSRCHRVGHYSKECRSSPMPHRRASSPRGYIGGSSSAVSLCGYSTDDEDWELVEDEGHELLEVDDQGYPRRYSDDLLEYDNGVLVYYGGGSAPGKAWPRSSVRHVVGV